MMDKRIMSFTEFMKVHGPYMGWPPDKVEAMGRQEMNEGKDLLFQVRDVFYTIPLISLQQYFGVVPIVELVPLSPMSSVTPEPVNTQKKLPKI